MRRSSRFALLLVLPLLALTAAGCANGKVEEANRYVNAVNAAQTTFTAQSDRLVAEIGPDTAGRPAVVRQRLNRFYGTVDAFAARLRAIHAPARVQALHRRLIAAITTFGRSLRVAGSGLTSGDASKILDGQARLASATSLVTRAINSTIAAINTRLKG